MVNNHSDSERGNICTHMGYSFRLAARVLLYAPSHRQDSTYHSLCYTSRGALDGTRNSSMGPPWRIDPTTHRTMSERSYHGATSRSDCYGHYSIITLLWTYWAMFQQLLHDWHNKGCGMCYPICGMIHIKEPLLLIAKSSPCDASGFPLSLSGPLPYV